MTKLPALRATSNEMLHLDLMRFIASCGIVFHHSHEFFSPIASRQLVMDRSAGLSMLVDLFFVISGFVIAHVYHGSVQSIGRFCVFIQRRIGRLGPLNWLTFAVFVAVWSILAKLGISKNHLPPSAAPACVAAQVLFLHAFVDCPGGFFNGPSWSIGAEMVMYLCFPLAAVLGARAPRLLLVLSIGLLIPGLAAAYALGGATFDANAWQKVHPLLRAAPAFSLGATFFYNRQWIGRAPMPEALLWAATTVMLACMAFGAPAVVDLALIYAVVILAIASDRRQRPSLFVQKYAPLGQLTYSIYMWHGLFILVLMNGIGDKLLHGRLSAVIPLAAVCYAGLFLWSLFSFLKIETPARRWIDGLQPPWKRRSPASSPS